MAAVMTLEMGLRCQDITRRKVGDLDGRGSILRIEEAKTDNSEGEFPIPLELRPYLLELCEGRGLGQPLFAARGGKHHWRDWPTKAIKRICRTAGVPLTCQQAMKGKRGDILRRRGYDMPTISRELHHGDTKVTRGHYVDRQAGEEVGQQRLRGHLRTLQDGGPTR